MQSIISGYVRQHDRDHFICSLFVSRSVRRNYLALYAFNIEINNIIYDCSETMTALVRLQWWRERISMIYCNKIVNDNQVILELANVIYSAAIPEFLINDYLDGYEQMVYQPLYRNTPNLEKIAAQTTVTLIKILFTATIQNYSNDQLAYHCGVAWHLMNSLRNTATERLDEETMVSIIERAEYHINQVKKLIKTAPKEIVKITLQTRLAGLYLKRIRNKKSDVISEKIGMISPIMQINMLFYYFSI